MFGSGERKNEPMKLVKSAKNELRTYYVVFQDSDHNRPWHFFTPEKSKHCWVFFPRHDGTLRINPLGNYIDVDYWRTNPENLAPQYLKEDKRVVDIVKIVLPLKNNLSYNIRGLINCVTIVKAVMSINKFFILTPLQLHKYLISIGGVSLK